MATMALQSEEVRTSTFYMHKISWLWRMINDDVFMFQRFWTLPNLLLGSASSRDQAFLAFNLPV
jgi:hypothetical protein